MRMTPRILIIDDDSATLLALSDALKTRMSDAMIDTAQSAGNGLEMMARSEYDTIICDVVMPGMSGMKLVEAAQKLRPEAVIVLMTAGDIDIKEKALAIGAHTFVAKPLDINRFVSVVTLALQRAQLLTRLREENRKRRPEDPPN
jgi:DNA-binding NtrC family response regulator